MHDVDELTDRLRGEGLRVTPQRRAVMQYLVGNTSHPTVEAIFDAVRAELPSVSLKTVYQTVHDLDALGEVRLLDVGTGAVRVDPNVEHVHHHLVCQRCGAVRDVSPEVATELPAAQRRRFTVTSVEVIFRGRCDRCAP